MSSLFRTRKNKGNHSKIERRFFIIERRLDEHDKRLDAIEQKLEEHDKRFDRIEEKLDKITETLTIIVTDIKTMKQQLSNIETRVAALEDNMEGVKKYIKRESDFQEIRNRTFISKLYLYNKPTSIVTPIHIKKFYDHTGHEITEFDGFLLISTNPHIIPKPANELLARIPPHISTTSLLRNNIESYNPQLMEREYILIESKHALSKGKVDKKLRQIEDIKRVFRTIHERTTTKTHDQYETWMKIIVNDTGLPVDKLDANFNLIFSSDDISEQLVNYIIAINNGITEEEYESHTLELFFSDMYIKDIITTITKNNKIHKTKRDTLTEKPYKLHSIRDLFKDTDIKNIDVVKRQLPYINTFFIPFSRMNTYFQHMKGKVGVSQFNTVILPRLFAKSTLNNSQ